MQFVICSCKCPITVTCSSTTGSSSGTSTGSGDWLVSPVSSRCAWPMIARSAAHVGEARGVGVCWSTGSASLATLISGPAARIETTWAFSDRWACIPQRDAERAFSACQSIAMV